MPRRLSKKKIGAQFSLLATENYNRGVAQKDVDVGLVVANPYALLLNTSTMSRPETKTVVRGEVTESGSIRCFALNG